MNTFPTTLDILTSMITPAVLISACGALILSTSLRLGRVVDRVRTLSDRFEEMAHSEAAVALFEERRALIFDQLDKLTSRARLLQRSITALYSSLGIMVGTSVAIGLVAVVGRYLWIQWIPIALTLIGIGFLFYSSILLIFEARLALVGVHAEMDFLWRLGQQYRPPTADRHGQDRS
jgi:hypothetical protein